MASDTGSEEVSAVDVDTPELAQTVDGVVDGLKVLGETSRGDEVVDLAVGLDDLGDTGVDGLLVADVCVVSSDLGDTEYRISGVGKNTPNIRIAYRSALGFSLTKASTRFWHCFSASSSVKRVRLNARPDNFFSIDEQTHCSCQQGQDQHQSKPYPGQ